MTKNKAWNLAKEVLLMFLHSITRGTNYIVMLFTRLVQAIIIRPYLLSENLTPPQKWTIIIESEIIVNCFLILFFFTYSPIREYIQRNWKTINIVYTVYISILIEKIKNIWKK